MAENNAKLIFQVTTGEGAFPVADANVVVYGENGLFYRVLVTDLSGKTPELFLDAPRAEESLTPDFSGKPYREVNAQITANGYVPITLRGIQLFDGVETISAVNMEPVPKNGVRGSTVLDVSGTGLLKREELREDAVPKGDERILTEVYIPSRITVHLGTPDNSYAQNETVDFPYYIKNVASSEIYPTWPENALRANILAQITFALNRIFTEWYRSRGYNFDITNSTAYDQYYVKGRPIFENISRIVDDIFDEYVRKIGALNPLFTQYCNGSTVTCGGLSQWGTVTLANQGYSPLRILQYYYGNNIEIVSANDIRAITSSYPGYPLSVGSSGEKVKILQNQLLRIGKNYPAINGITAADGVFGSGTQSAVEKFQRVFNLTPDGVVGKATWNKISYIYTAVRRLAELNGESEPLPEGSSSYPQIAAGSRGEYVRLAQYFLRVISGYYSAVPSVSIDGIFGNATKNAVISFQKMMGLTPDGIVGRNTWDRLKQVFLGIVRTQGLEIAYPGTPLKLGSRGDNVWIMQTNLNKLSEYYDIPFITADGVFGNNTRNAVLAFQRLAGISQDGVIGPDTWKRIISARLLV